MRKHRSAALAAATLLLLTGAGIATAPAAWAGVPGGTRADDRNHDFDGDGFDDVLAGAPGATVGGKRGAGLVTVQYGSPDGIDTRAATIVSQDTTGVPGAAETGDSFGAAVATGDLDGDGYDDAVIGAPGEDIGTRADVGGVIVLWGSPHGLVGTDSQWVDSLNGPVAGARFGSAFAAARFTAETSGDQLIVLDRRYVEWHRFGAASGTGGARLAADRRAHTAAALDRTTLAPSGARAAGTAAAPVPRDLVAKSVTTGDYDKNGFADLVVSGVTTGAEPGHGWSWYLAGGTDSLVYQRELRGGPVTASGDIDGDGYDDLVTGEPHSPDDGGESMTGGLVGVYRGGPNGPAGATGVGTPPQWWTQNSAGVPGASERGDGWGTDLSLGDTDRDGYADLAIGAPGEDIGTVVDVGMVTVLRGTARGLTGTGAASWTQDSPSVPGAVERDDRFGGQVRLVDPDADGRFSLLAAAPGENTADGHVWLFPARTGGLTATGSWSFGVSSFGGPYLDARYGSAIDE
ncbi:FG-GAP repeat protein [Streptomyces sp. NBC_00094]|uniref:FG-GAP repeat protein n=1 Tax=Streptomyces sp. NBC_00094 TaxID=2903620 RepID=UPI00225A34D0|nr:FG-GAP repeat protein [Streptomyces sp. NBC_00094]MCX5389945.1 integrin alpha [Streptomyces sp. NBC_00094]